jgi:hypothetical protein
MPDIRDLLDEAAGHPRDLPDVAEIMHRARPRRIRRRAGAAVLAVAASAGVVAGVVTVSKPDQPTIVQPGPSPGQEQARTIREGQLEPGRYQGEVRGRSFVLEVGNDDWSVLTTQPEWLALTHRQYVLHLQQWASVVPPSSDDGTARERVPEDLVGWLQANPRLAVQNATPLVVGGLDGVALDIRVVTPLEDAPRECTSSACVLLATIAGTDEAVDIEQGQLARLVVLGEPGQQLVLSYRAPERQFPVLDQAVDDLLKGLRFDEP